MILKRNRADSLSFRLCRRSARYFSYKPTNQWCLAISEYTTWWIIPTRVIFSGFISRYANDGEDDCARGQPMLIEGRHGHS
uniref:Uncharacterized protein n=1 Tax=Heterorhabditis bacteriophora TaxID=37862 RepID=A0A1I7XES3_HETBA